VSKLKNLLLDQRWRDRAKVLFLIFWIALIFYFSSIPSLFPFAKNPLEVVPRKLAHFFEYGLLTFLLYKVVSLGRYKLFRRNLSLAIFFAVLFSISDEYHQSFIFGRHATLTDVLIDVFGVLVVAFLLILEREHQELNPSHQHLIKI